MSNLVLDASAILAVLQQEPGGVKVMGSIATATGSVYISSVNYCEVIGKLVQDGIPAGKAQVATELFLRYVVEFSVTQAERAGELILLTREQGLSLGDRACLAWAEEKDATVFTLDSLWKRLDIGVRVELIRS